MVSTYTSAETPSQNDKGRVYLLQGYDEAPPRQLRMSVFSAALNGVCFTYSTSSQTSDLRVFMFPKATSCSLSL